MLRRTKIVATLGPATDDPAVLEDVVRRGADVVRVNFSHGEPEAHRRRVEGVRRAAARVGKHVAVLGDLQGPKIRIEGFADGRVMLDEGARFALDPAIDPTEGTARGVGITYHQLAADVHAGDALILGDGQIELAVESVHGGRVDCRVTVGGELSDHKGINRRGGGLSAKALTDKDREDVRLAASLDVDYLAVSFVRQAADVEEARALLRAAGSDARIVSKIERSEAIPRLEEIIRASDAVMVARGDLGVEVGYAQLTGIQKQILHMARSLDRVTITATQMMESMILSPVPTRAEVSDVANAVLDGTDAVMLSAETAAGKYPVETITQMAAIALEAEAADDASIETDFTNKRFGRIDQSIAMGALFTAHHLGCKAILALTESGSTALWMSRHNIKVPIYGLTTQLVSQRKMALYRNVRPLLMPALADRDEALARAESLLVELGVLKRGDTYAITCGEPMGHPGGTNMLKVCRVGG